MGRERIGSYPLLTAEEARSALDAALAAWDRGRGAWPTMGVAARIGHVESFVHESVRDGFLDRFLAEVGASDPGCPGRRASR